MDCAEESERIVNTLDTLMDISEAEKGIVNLKSESTDIVSLVRDNGIGIPAQDLPRIFDRLFRGEKGRSQRGLGLGLSMVQAVIRAHKGRIEVESHPGIGSTFKVLLPLAATPHCPAS